MSPSPTSSPISPSKYRVRPVWKITGVIFGIWVLMHIVAIFQSCGHVAQSPEDLGWTIPSSH